MFILLEYLLTGVQIAYFFSYWLTVGCLGPGLWFLLNLFVNKRVNKTSRCTQSLCLSSPYHSSRDLNVPRNKPPCNLAIIVTYFRRVTLLEQ
jgi:hypothetical protein